MSLWDYDGSIGAYVQTINGWTCQVNNYGAWRVSKGGRQASQGIVGLADIQEQLGICYNGGERPHGEDLIDAAMALCRIYASRDDEDEAAHNWQALTQPLHSGKVRGYVAMINCQLCSVTWRGRWSVMSGGSAAQGTVTVEDAINELGLTLAPEVWPTDAQMMQVARQRATKLAVRGRLREGDIE